jgi:O-antigen/teichoic acid export membrane protein
VNPLSRIARLSAGFLTSNLVRGVISFVLSLAIGRALGVDRFGVWILCSTWASTLTAVADLGLGLLLPRDGARTRESDVGSRDSLGSLCASALVLRLLVALPAAFVMMVVAPRLTANGETAAGLATAATLGAAGAVYGCFGSTFRSQPKWVPAILIAETAAMAVQLGASLLALWIRPGATVAMLLGIAVGVQLLQIATAVVLWRIAFPGDALRISSVGAVRRLATRTVPFAATGLIANLQTRIAPLLLGYLAAPADLGAFAAAAKFGTVARLVPGAIFAGALPVLSHEHERRDSMSRAAFVTFDRVFAGFAVATSIAIVFARPLLWRIYGASFAAAAPALVWIGIGIAPALTNSATRIALYATGAERAAVVWSAVSLATQTLAALLWIPPFGAPGAAAAIALAETVIWLPLRRARTARRTPTPSSPRRAPASTYEPRRPVAADVPDPAVTP